MIDVARKRDDHAVRVCSRVAHSASTSSIARTSSHEHAVVKASDHRRVEMPQPRRELCQVANRIAPLIETAALGSVASGNAPLPI